jgi:hypothetical protein
MFLGNLHSTPARHGEARLHGRNSTHHTLPGSRAAPVPEEVFRAGLRLGSARGCASCAQLRELRLVGNAIAELPASMALLAYLFVLEARKPRRAAHRHLD